MTVWRVPEGQGGCRLDYILRKLQPDLGLRAARRMIRDGLVKVDGRNAVPGQRLAQGAEIVATQGGEKILATANARFLEIQGEYCFFYKPRGMHTVSLAGRTNTSLERVMPMLLAQNGIDADVRLLQRLDCGTSGIVAGAMTEAAMFAYRQAEKAGRCGKYYLAVLSGRLEQPAWSKNRLDCQGGKGVRIRDEASAMQLEWTYFAPLAHADNLTLVRCVIKMGKRHQIRAHAAALGFPLYGDGLYGGSTENHFWLEHYCLQMPGVKIRCHDDACGIDALFPDAGKLLEEKTCIL